MRPEYELGVSAPGFAAVLRNNFGVSPEGLRTRGDTSQFNLQQAIRMVDNMFGKIGAPRRVQRGAFTVAGLMGSYSHDTVQGIPILWERFGPHTGNISGPVGTAAYGLISMNESGFDYLAGVEVDRLADLPPGFATRKLPAPDYAAFEHHGHVSGIRETRHVIWSNWQQNASIEPAEGMPDFEFYGDRFDARTGAGVVEIWIGAKG